MLYYQLQHKISLADQPQNSTSYQPPWELCSFSQQHHFFCLDVLVVDSWCRISFPSQYCLMMYLTNFLPRYDWILTMLWLISFWINFMSFGKIFLVSLFLFMKIVYLYLVYSSTTSVCFLPLILTRSTGLNRSTCSKLKGLVQDSNTLFWRMTWFVSHIGMHHKSCSLDIPSCWALPPIVSLPICW